MISRNLHSTAGRPRGWGWRGEIVKKKMIIIFILKTHEQPWVVHGARKNVMSIK